MDIDDINNIFEEANRDVVGETPLTFGEKTIMNIQAEYIGEGTYIQERQAEKKKVEEEIRALRKKLRNAKNVRNHRKAGANTTMFEKRKAIKRKIAELELKLEDIAIEEGQMGVGE